jgi:hypothetical protein
MPFRILFALSYVVFVIGVSRFVGEGFENAIVKGVFLATAIVFLATREVDKVVVALLGATFVLVFGAAMFTSYPGFSWSILFNSLNQFFIVFALLAGVPNRQDYRFVLITSSLVPLLFLVFAILYQVSGQQNLMAREFASSLYRLGGQLNPAFVSGLAMCGTFSTLQLILAGRKNFIFLAGVNLVILLAAGGRMALVDTVVLCGASIIVSQKITASNKISYVGGALLAAVPLAAIYGPQMMTRFSTSGDNGREIIWQYLYYLAAEYPSGIGFGHEFFSVPRQISVQTGSPAAHNDFIRIMVELGYTGVSLFYIFVSLAVLRVAFRKNNSGGIIMIVAYGCFLLLSYTDNALATPPYFPIVFLAYLANLGGQFGIASEASQRKVPISVMLAERRVAMMRAAEEEALATGGPPPRGPRLPRESPTAS